VIVVVVYFALVAALSVVGLRTDLDPPEVRMAIGVIGIVAWALYPGIAAWSASQSKSETAIWAVAIALPAMLVGAVIVGPRFQKTDAIVPFAAAIGVFGGMWAGDVVMRGGGARRTIAGFVAGALVGSVLAAPLAIVGTILHTATTN
jgi:hypothetical protein